MERKVKKLILVYPINLKWKEKYDLNQCETEIVVIYRSINDNFQELENVFMYFSNKVSIFNELVPVNRDISLLLEQYLVNGKINEFELLEPVNQNSKIIEKLSNVKRTETTTSESNTKLNQLALKNYEFLLSNKLNFEVLTDEIVMK